MLLQIFHISCHGVLRHLVSRLYMRYSSLWIFWMTLRGPGWSAERLDGGVVQLGKCRGPRRPEDRISVLTSSAAPAVGRLGTL